MEHEIENSNLKRHMCTDCMFVVKSQVGVHSKHWLPAVHTVTQERTPIGESY